MLIVLVSGPMLLGPLLDIPSGLMPNSQALANLPRYIRSLEELDSRELDGEFERVMMWARMRETVKG
jgi:hypothetical protein